MIKQLRNPDVYHGMKMRNFFEGWYFKLVDVSSKHSYAIIPGIFKSEQNNNSHSFIQILDGNNMKYNYNKYAFNKFTASTKKLEIQIDNNKFTNEFINVNIDKDDLLIKGYIEFNNIDKWNDSFFNPGSMGYYNYLPFMQCYSQVCALSVDLSGSLNVNNKIIDFNGGKGYIEKNWGKTFPASWIWVQCNNFRTKNLALSCSIGHIPFLFKTFRGFLVGLKHKDNFYKFTTMNKSKLSICNNLNDIEIKVENRNYVLNIKTKSYKKDFILCNGPQENNMLPLVEETLKGITWVKLVDKLSGCTILEDMGCCTGIEYGGSQNKILG